MFGTLFCCTYTAVFYVFDGFYLIISMLHTVLPFGIDVGLLAVGAYYLTKLKKPSNEDVMNIFGPEIGSKESEQFPDKVVRCIAHRGAGFDAPENTLEAFKYCVENQCNIVELDVRTTRDGKLVLLHDQGLQRLVGSTITDIRATDWESIKDINVAESHPNRAKFKEAHLCLLDDAVDYLLEHNMRFIIDVKGEDKAVVEGVLDTYKSRPSLYKNAAITCFNPWILYQIRKKDPQIVGAMSYRPYAFSAQEYDAERGPVNPRFGENLPLQLAVRALDVAHAQLWRRAARWCGVSAVLLHKDVVSPSEVLYWRSRGVRCAGWCVNRPLEKLYWRGVLKAPYLANTLVGEPEPVEKLYWRGLLRVPHLADNFLSDLEVDKKKADEADRAGPLVDKLLEPERKLSTGQN